MVRWLLLRSSEVLYFFLQTQALSYWNCGDFVFPPSFLLDKTGQSEGNKTHGAKVVCSPSGCSPLGAAFVSLHQKGNEGKEEIRELPLPFPPPHRFWPTDWNQSPWLNYH